MQHFQAVCREKIDSPSGLVSLVLFQPEEAFTFAEWQFMMITHQDEKRTLKKPYSIATTNTQLQNEKRIGFIVKKTSENGMSAFLTTECNYTVTLTWPVGHYRNNNVSEHYLFVSTWSGLSPNVGIRNALLERPTPQQRIVFLYGEKHLDNLLPEMRTRADESIPWVTTHIYLSRQLDAPSNYKTGYVQDGLTESIATLGTQTACFICGLPEMVQDVQQRLMWLWVPKEYINDWKVLKKLPLVRGRTYCLLL
jgi:NAD(P)H-flavin reductase